MLRSKFWSGLRNDRIKDATRHHYEAGLSFEDLLVEARAREEEFSRGSKQEPAKVQSKGASAQAGDGVGAMTTELKAVTQQLKEITTRLDRLEKSGNHKPSPHQSQRYQKPREDRRWQIAPQDATNYQPQKSSSSQRAAAGTKPQPKGKRRCFRCNSDLHVISQCPN